MLLKPLIQWIHVGSVVLMIGGFFFFRVVLIPIAKRRKDSDTLISSALRRFSGIVWGALLSVLLSGLYNVITFFRTARNPNLESIISDYSLYILVLGVKFFLVFVIYTFAIILTFPYPVFEPVQKKPSPLLNMLIFFALIIIFLSAFLRRIA